MAIRELFGKIFGSSANFVLIVRTTRDLDNNALVSCVLMRGNQPRTGNRFRITRTGKTGTMADTTSFGETLGMAKKAGAFVDSAGSESSLQSLVAFRTSDVPTDDFKTGDEIVAC